MCSWMMRESGLVCGHVSRRCRITRPHFGMKTQFASITRLLPHYEEALPREDLSAFRVPDSPLKHKAVGRRARQKEDV
jgi:hypothetical protein